MSDVSEDESLGFDLHTPVTDLWSGSSQETKQDEISGNDEEPKSGRFSSVYTSNAVDSSQPEQSTPNKQRKRKRASKSDGGKKIKLSACHLMWGKQDGFPWWPCFSQDPVKAVLDPRMNSFFPVKPGHTVVQFFPLGANQFAVLADDQLVPYDDGPRSIEFQQKTASSSFVRKHKSKWKTSLDEVEDAVKATNATSNAFSTASVNEPEFSEDESQADFTDHGKRLLDEVRSPQKNSRRKPVLYQGDVIAYFAQRFGEKRSKVLSVNPGKKFPLELETGDLLDDEDQLMVVARGGRPIRTRGDNCWCPLRDFTIVKGSSRQELDVMANTRESVKQLSSAVDKVLSETYAGR